MKKILMLTAAVMALQALPALAGEDGGHKGGKHGKGGMGIFDMQDTDKDGFVTKEEYLKFSTDSFTESDSNKDGKVSKEEVKAHREAMKAKWMEKQKAQAGKEATPPAEASAKAAE